VTVYHRFGLLPLNTSVRAGSGHWG
jgi:hypothetical protein